MASEINAMRYEVEDGTDDRVFQKIGRVNANQLNTTQKVVWFACLVCRSLVDRLRLAPSPTRARMKGGEAAVRIVLVLYKFHDLPVLKPDEIDASGKGFYINICFCRSNLNRAEKSAFLVIELRL
jgi:hypothetical protein